MERRRESRDATPFKRASRTWDNVLPLPLRERAGVRGKTQRVERRSHAHRLSERFPLTLTLSRKGRGRPEPDGPGVARRIDVPTLAAMFTGIVEKTVRVIGVADGPEFVRITLPTSWDDVRDGESVAVNGVCLTVAETLARRARVRRHSGDAGQDEPGAAQSRRRGARRALAARRRPHRRPLRAGPRRRHRPAARASGRRQGMAPAAASARRRWSKFLVPKGSVCLDGVSLTVAASGATSSRSR